MRAALAGYRPFVFPRSGLNPFVGADFPAAAALVAPLLGDDGGGGGGMEYANPAEANSLGDGIVVRPALPPTIWHGSVFPRAENALLIPVGWREARGVTPWDEMGLEGTPTGEGARNEPDAVAPYAIEDMPLEGPAYIDQLIDLEDDLYGDSQAGDIAVERRDLEPEEDTAMDFEHPIHTGATPQLATSADQTYAAATGINEGFNEGMTFEAGADADLGGNREDDLHANNQAGDTMEDQQTSWPNLNTAMNVDNPIYPGATPQLPTMTERNRALEDDLNANNQADNNTEDQQGPEPMDTTGMDVEHPIFPGTGPQPAIGGNDENNGVGFVAGEEGEVDLNGVDDNTALAQAFDLTPAELDAIISGVSNLAVPDYHPSSLNEQPIAFNNNFHIQNEQAARTKVQPAIWDEQPAVYNYDFLDRNVQGAIPQGHPMDLNEHMASWNYHSVISNHQAAAVGGRPAGLNYSFPDSNNQTATAEGQPVTWNSDFAVSNHQAANNQAAVIEDQPASMNYNFLDLNQGAAIEHRPEPANLNEQPAAMTGQRGVAWPDFNEDEWEAQMEALRLSFGGNPAPKRARE
jgi:hypothetical protein